MEDEKNKKYNIKNNVYNYLANFCLEEQNKINEEDAENAIIYGIECYRVKFSKFEMAEICLSSSDNNKLDIFIKDDSKIKSVNLEHINNIIIRHQTRISTLYNFDKRYNYIFDILEKKKYYQLFFKEKKTLLIFIKGLLTITRKNYENSNGHMNLSQIIQKNVGDEIDNEELEYLETKMGIDIYKLKYHLDKNKGTSTPLKEIKSFVQQKLSGEKFRPIFEKYSTLIDKNNERVLGPIDLQNFFKEYQKEEISYLEACQIIIEFNSENDNITKKNCIQSFEDLLLSKKAFNQNNINSILSECNKNKKNSSGDSGQLRLYMTLYEFNMMLHSSLLTVYDRNKLNQKLDLDHPLTDYFICGSHNTYLTGHQLLGKSSTKMYSTSLLYNFRMVELDCYEGEGDEIIITHGYTLVDDLFLDDVLIELKETAFTNSDLPVILSIENHLGEKYQDIMVEKLKNILKDLYIFPYDLKPDHVPNLRDLRKKFLIKCGGSKLWENENIPRKEHVKQFYNLSNSNFSLNQIINTSEQIIPKKIIFLTKKGKSRLKTSKTMIPNLKRTKNIYINKKRGVETATKGLEKILGIIGVKYMKEKIDTNYYKPWEMMTIKCSKSLKFSEDINEKKSILNLTKHCLIRIYPDNFDSSNYNIIKCFSCGIQGCCLNIQSTEDDFTLYNKIFFKQKEGKGYILKPERYFSNEFICSYDKPNYICKMEILSIINLYGLIEELKLKYNKDMPLNLSIYVIGIREDEYNLKCDFKLINGALFPQFENGNPKVEFKVYDFELSAILIKITLDDKLIGRGCIPYCFMKQGLRRIPIYDNQCYNMKNAYMVGHFCLEKYK